MQREMVDYSGAGASAEDDDTDSRSLRSVRSVSSFLRDRARDVSGGNDERPSIGERLASIASLGRDSKGPSPAASSPASTPSRVSLPCLLDHWLLLLTPFFAFSNHHCSSPLLLLSDARLSPPVRMTRPSSPFSASWSANWRTFDWAKWLSCWPSTGNWRRSSRGSVGEARWTRARSCHNAMAVLGLGDFDM